MRERNIEVQRKSSKDYVERHKADGRCVRCPAQAVPNRTLCPRCALQQATYVKGRRKENNARQRTVRLERRAAGQCTDCGLPAALDHTKCMLHVEADRARVDRYREANPRPRKAKIAHETCLWCSDPPRAERSMCDKHLQQAKVNKALYRARRAAGMPKRSYIQRGLFIGPIQRRVRVGKSPLPRKKINEPMVNWSWQKSVDTAPLCSCGKHQVMRGGALCFGCARLIRSAA